MSLLRVENLTAGYGKNRIIDNISLEVSEGEIVGLLGPNGCGKSTLIKALCKGNSSEGNVTVCERDLKDFSEKELAKICSYVPQSSGLAIDISALEVVLMGFYPYLGLLERPDIKMKEKAGEMLQLVGLEKEVQTNYMELSEGQKRMCILARSLVADAKMLLLDEPDASLDFAIRNRLLTIIEKQVKEKETGVLLSLHDTNLALSCCDKIYLMKDGRLIHIVHPKEDSISEMEEKLQQIYGNVKLLEYKKEQEAFANSSKEDKTRNLVMVQA